MEISPIRAFRDNYIWMLRRGARAAVVDPGDAAPVFDALERAGASLAAILVTHHHGDHVGGLDALLDRFDVPVFGPAAEAIDGVTRTLREPDSIRVPGIDIDLVVIDVPGHTRGHVAYYGPNMLFCGDTLFACGCGRLFEGTPAQMQASLAKLAALPPETRVYSAHEYTQANLRFARAVEPDNADLLAWHDDVARLRAADLPTLPTTLAHDRAVNPFLRWSEPAVIAAARRHAPGCASDPVGVFAAIRTWKDAF
jgi:hydroxyacylglutathione hydrolase